MSQSEKVNGHRPAKKREKMTITFLKGCDTRSHFWNGNHAIPL